MATSVRLVGELKRQLKRRQLTYRALAARLGLSESAVKQMFAAGNMSLKRLDAVCEVLGLDIGELVELAERDERRIERLSLEQEAELVREPRLLVVAYCVVNRWSFEEIVATYRIDETECVRRLATLDRMKLIELLPGNRIRTLTAGDFGWHADGPIERYFRTEVQGQYFDSGFDADGCLRIVKNGDTSLPSRHRLIERLRSIGAMFDDTSLRDRQLPRERRQGTTMVLAIRDWRFSAFVELEREPASEAPASD